MDIEHLANSKIGGKSYAEIRAELARNGMSGEEIRQLLRKVDDRVLEKIHDRDQLRKARIWYIAGLILAISGILLIVARNAGLLMASSPVWILYPVFFAGIAFMIHARTLRRKSRVKTTSITGAIRRKRPFK